MKEAALLLLEERNNPGQYLFARRQKDRDELPDRWSLPAEFIEPDESPREAAVRCADEELGLTIQNVQEVDQHTFPEEDKKLYYFTAEYTEEPRIEEERELAELKWYSLDEFFSEYEDEQIGHGLQYLRNARADLEV